MIRFAHTDTQHDAMITWAHRFPAVVLLGALLVFPATAQTRLTREEAFAQYFPDRTVDRKTAFLTDDQVSAIRDGARAPVDSKLLTYYVVRQGTSLDAVAFLETSVVKTMPATYMVIVDPDTTIRAIEILAFYEPADYAPPRRWLDQFNGKGPSDDLFVKRGIAAMTGATLSAQALAAGARRVLAAYRTVVAQEVSR